VVQESVDVTPRAGGRSGGHHGPAHGVRSHAPTADFFGPAFEIRRRHPDCRRPPGRWAFFASVRPPTYGRGPLEGWPPARPGSPWGPCAYRSLPEGRSLPLYWANRGRWLQLLTAPFSLQECRRRSAGGATSRREAPLAAAALCPPSTTCAGICQANPAAPPRARFSCNDFNFR
jgi:hypothetical protein